MTKAVTETPPIVCPSWCALMQQEHVNELRDAGYIVHWSRVHRIGSAEFTLGATTAVDGTPDVDDPDVLLHLDYAPDQMTLEQAEAFARGILAGVEEARA